MAVCVSAHKEASRRWHHGPTSVEVLMVPAIQPRRRHVIWLRTGCGSPVDDPRFSTCRDLVLEKTAPTLRITGDCFEGPLITQRGPTAGTCRENLSSGVRDEPDQFLVLVHLAGVALVAPLVAQVSGTVGGSRRRPGLLDGRRAAPTLRRPARQSVCESTWFDPSTILTSRRSELREAVQPRD
jgi:hypothetical protein